MKIKKDLTTREGYFLSLTADETRVRFKVTDGWTQESFQFELGSIAANILANFVKDTIIVK